jgi:hypothetical protein
MLTIISSSPENLEDNVYLDKTIEITFSHELHDTSLTDDNFKVYTMPGWSSQATLSSITKNGPNVILTTEINFQPNQQYAIWIKGDDIVDDELLKGVASIIGDTMLGNQVITFTTGTKVIADDAEVPETGVPAEDLEDIDPIDPSIVDNEFLDVIGTYPNNGVNNLSGVANVVFEFDQKVDRIDATGGINNPISGVIDLQVEHYIFGQESGPIPGIFAEDIQISENKLIFTIDQTELTVNNKYTFTLHKNKVFNLENQSMPADYTINFGTTLVPMYTNSDMVRLKGGSVIPPELDDYTINRYIHMASIDISKALGHTTWLTAPYDYRIVMATTYKVICELANGVIYGDLRFISEEQLADLKIKYNTGSVKDTINDYCDIADKYLMELNPSAFGAGTGVKSGTKGDYPGKKRHIHKYSKRRFGG